MNVRRGALCFAAVLLLTACPKKESDDEEDTPTKKTSATATAAPTPTEAPTPAKTPTPIATEAAIPTPAGGGVKAELDNRSDGINGTAVNVAGAKAAVQAPSNWTAGKGGDAQTYTAGDQKARIAATSFGADGPAKKLEAAATAAGLTGCTFGTAENVTVGKDKLAGQAADGTCQRGAGTVKAAYMATEGLLVLGSWDDGGDSVNVFGSMRSVTKAAGGTGDASGIGACCAALRQNAKSAPPQQVGAYLAAAAACDAVRNNPQGKAALAGVRAALAGANMPGACK